MGGKGSGAPMGNLNAAKNILPAIKRVQQGRSLPASLTRITTLADREAQELISDRGGTQVMSGAERLMIGIWKSARQIELLIWNELIERGAIESDENGNWDLQAGVQRLGPLLVAQHRALTSLGLERKKENVKNLKDYLRETYVTDLESVRES